MDYLRVDAKESNPMGSPANAAVRAYLIQQITTIGLTPEVQTTTVVSHWPMEVTTSAHLRAFPSQYALNAEVVLTAVSSQKS
jgi:hypothetical protein